MSIHRRNPRRDATEPELVDYLRARGALVIRLSAANVPDLLVGWCGRWLLLECKVPGAGLSPGQEEFATEARRRGLLNFVVSTVEQVKEILDAQSRLSGL